MPASAFDVWDERGNGIGVFSIDCSKGAHVSGSHVEQNMVPNVIGDVRRS